MRNALLLSACLFLLSACADMDEMFGDRRGGNSHYDDANRGGYNRYAGGYYPYGNANYPRERIYIIQPSNPCSGNSYRGYCYRYDEDYRRAREYDHSKGYDDAWYQKHRNDCAQNDCSRGRDDSPRHDNNRHDDHRKDRHDNRDYGNRGDDSSRNDNNRHDNKVHDGYSWGGQNNEHDRQQGRDHSDDRYQNDDGHSQRRTHYQSVTPASQGGRYDTRDRVPDSQQKDQDNRQKSSRSKEGGGYVSRQQGGEDRVADPKPNPRVEAGNPGGALDQPIEHGAGRPDDAGYDRGHGGMKHEPDPPAFAEPLVREEPPMMREPEPAFEPPARHEEPSPRQEPARRPPAEESEQVAPAAANLPPVEAPPAQ